MDTAVLPPGFRFHPTDEELVVYYLKGKAIGKRVEEGVIRELDIYRYEPADLPALSVLPSRDPEWYFFNHQDRNTSRISRTTRLGYWKATGKDRTIRTGARSVGAKKTLVYYEGRAPNGHRTDWIMHEYRLDEDLEKKIKIRNHCVLCRLRRKGGPGPRNGEQYGAPPILDDCDVESNDQPTEVSEVNEVNENVHPGPSMEVPLGVDIDDWNKLTSLLFSENEESPEFEGFTSGNHFILNQNGSEAGTNLDSNLLAATNSAAIDVNGFDNLHEILHPAPEEADMLGEMLNLINHEGEVINTENGSASDAVLSNHNQSLSGEAVYDLDFLELADLEQPLEGSIPNLPFDSLLSMSNFEFDTGIETLMATRGFQEALVDQGTASRRLRLQLPVVPPAESNGGSNHRNELLIPEVVSAHDSGLGDMSSVEVENTHNQLITLDDQNTQFGFFSTGTGLNLDQPDVVHYSAHAAVYNSPPVPADLVISSASQEGLNDKPLKPVGTSHSKIPSSSMESPLSPTSLFRVVLGFLEGIPALPASAFEATPESAKLKSSSNKSNKSINCNSRQVGNLGSNSAGSILHHRIKRHATSEVEPVTEMHEISDRRMKRSMKGCGLGFSVFLFRVATVTLILFCLFRGFCKFTRSAFTAHL